MRRSSGLVLVSIFLIAPLMPGCQADLGQRQGQVAPSFGAIVYREACQRVTYTEDLRSTTHPLDVSGVSRRALCEGQADPAPDDPADVKALAAQRQAIVQSVDAALPDDATLDSLDAYLRALTPLMDDGTVSALLARSGTLLENLSKDAGVTTALSHLDYAGGIRPPSTQGGVIRALAGAPGLDDVTGATLPLFVPGGAARGPFTALLQAGAFELRHLSVDADPYSTLRTPSVLRQLLIARSDALSTGHNLYVALRDPRGLPLLANIVPPYTADPKTGLARADAAGHFLDASNQPIPYVPPLPELGQVDKVKRDADGRALRADGQPLYQYAELDSSLLMALLPDAGRLVVPYPPTRMSGPQMDVVLGLLPGAALLSGSRDPAAVKQEDSETITYNGYSPKDAALLDLAHGALSLLRFRVGTDAPGQDLVNVLGSLNALMTGAKDESALARSLKALLAASDEAKKPQYNGAQIPVNSTLYDDLAPVLARIFAVPDRMDGGKPVSLLEDLVTALGDPHGKALGYMSAQLLNDRDYFFMKQPTQASDYNADGLIDPQMLGVVGSFGNAPDRSQPDSDATLDWRDLKTSDPQNNRSVMQRLLHMLADSNGQKPLCNGRNAVFSHIGPIVYPGECDMFQIDNVARFFLLSIATPALRQDASTFAKQAASFVEAVRNGKDCRGTSSDPQAKSKCDGLIDPDIGLIPDDPSTDFTLEGIMRIKGFGRYPDPASAARLFFLDLGDATTIPPFAPKRPKDLLFNHVDMAGTYVVDPMDPDARKIPDGNGVARPIIDEHNGVLFALEAVRGPATYPDGTTNPYPNDNFYDAFRPLVDAFARHYECFSRDMSGTCTSGQNAVQILADVMTVLHRHWPTARSQVFGRGFLGSYGPLVKPDGADTYEPLAATIMRGDLLPSSADLSPILSALTVDGEAGSAPALPLLQRLLRFVFDPSVAPPGLALRNGSTQAVRNDGQPAYADATLALVTGAKQDGKLTPYYLLAAGWQKKKQVFAMPQNMAAKQRWDQAISDAVDSFLGVDVSTAMGVTTYRFDDPRIRAVSGLVLGWLQQRVQDHQAMLADGSWGATLEKDLSDTTGGPLYAAGLDVGIQVDADDAARTALYTLLRQVLSEPANMGGGSLPPLAAAALDGEQLLLDDTDLVPIGRSLAGALDLQSGPVDPGLVLLKRGHELEQASPAIKVKPLLLTVLRNFYTPDASGIYPMFRLSDAIGEVDRATPGQGGTYTPTDYQVLLDAAGKFLVDQQRGMARFIQIVQDRK